MAKNKQHHPDRLPVGKFFAWKSRDISVACLTVIMGYLTIYCTDTLGMPAALVGTLLMASKVCDAVTDLFTGIIVDNTKTRWGKARPYEISIIGAWICTALLFFIPPAWSIVAKSVWVFIMYTFVFSIFTSMLGSAQTPYMIRAFKSRTLIAKVASYGGVVSTLGAMIVSVSFPVLMGRLATSPAGWRTLILIYAVPLGLMGMLRFIFVKEDPSIDEAAHQEKIGVKTVVRMMKSNKYLVPFVGLFLLFNIAINMNVMIYYYKYVVGNMMLMSIMGMLSVVLLPVMFTFPRLMRKFSVTNLITIGAGFAVIGYTLNFFAKANVAMLFAGGIFTGLATFPIAYLQAIIIMELATYNEWKGLPRMEGSIGIFSGFAGNVGIGMGTGLVGVLLGAAGYNGALATQSAGTILMIRFIMSVVPAIMMCGIVFCAIKLSKLEKEIPAIEKELSERKAASVNEVENVENVELPEAELQME